MNRKFLIIPEYKQLDKTIELAEQYNLGFEYNDFFDPWVYSDKDEVEKRCSTYLSLQLINSLDEEGRIIPFASRLDNALDLVKGVDTAGFLPDEKKRELEDILFDTYEGKEGGQPWFTEEEKEDLMIRKGTLTEKERKIMESHVEMTERILAKVHFNQNYQDAVKWAVQHHECLDGSGYPRHLKAEDLSTESRILAVADICDALLATDRPYKKPLPREKAFTIMRDMAKQGKIDEKLVNYLDQCLE